VNFSHIPKFGIFGCDKVLLLYGNADDGCQWKSRLLSAGSCTGARRRRRVTEGGLHL
jgi:hypothetical protein